MTPKYNVMKHLTTLRTMFAGVVLFSSPTAMSDEDEVMGDMLVSDLMTATAECGNLMKLGTPENRG